MSLYSEIPSATFREVDGKRYFVRKFGFNGRVYEEELVPIPTIKIIMTLDEDGNEIIEKREVIDLTKEPE